MDVELLLTEKTEENDSGNDQIPEIQDDCLSFPNMDETREEEKGHEEDGEEKEEEQEQEEEGDSKAEQQ